MRTRPGFTLLELLMVVAIVTMATALLLPIGLTAAANVKAALMTPIVLPES